MPETRDVCIVGGGVAGLTAGTFTARAGLDVLVVSTGESILRRNAHLENFPGFPAGVNSRLLLELIRDQADRAGCAFADGRVTAVDRADDGRLSVAVDGREDVLSDYVICASWSDSSYLEALDVGLIDRGSKTYVDVDENGYAGVDGLYAAGRLAEKRHQTVIAAGDGANVGVAVVEDSDVPFYHDWVAPEGYFTGRDREVPPGCEEIDEDERRERERESMETMREYFAEPHPDEPTQHPSVADDE
ncbi:MAG: FAD-binding protein [Haloarculaceae archaeon]